MSNPIQDEKESMQQLGGLENSVSRRLLLQRTLVLPVAAFIVACDSAARPTGPAKKAGMTSGTQTPTPLPSSLCNGSEVTPSQIEGPFYKSGSPARTSLREANLLGVPLTVTGYVFSTKCRPIVHAWLDFWQADSEGQYDTAGFKLRGHQYTDAQGRYLLKTILPGEYPGRTRHIHVKVQVPGRPILTTQIYFPGVVENSKDDIFSPKLLAHMQQTPEGQQATFNFILVQR